MEELLNVTTALLTPSTPGKDQVTSLAKLCVNTKARSSLLIMGYHNRRKVIPMEVLTSIHLLTPT